MAYVKRKISLDQVLKALGDPVRLSAVRQLLAADGREKACGTFDYKVTKATFSHHIAILEEAGIVQARHEGTRRFLSLRLVELERKFPGLMGLVTRAS